MTAPAPDLAQLLAGNRAALARAITLVESKRPDHRAAARDLLDAALPHAGRLHLTEVEAAPEGDVRFPEIPPDFREVAAEPHPAGPEDEHAFRFVTLERHV